VSTEAHRYAAIAEAISDLIRGGSLQAGDALPSVRSAALQHRVSKGTIVSAYSTLEARGLIEARPQSGFYVRGRLNAGLAVPRSEIKYPKVVRLDQQTQVRDALGDLCGTHATSLGSSFPDPSLYPLDVLGRALVANVRSTEAALAGTDLQLGLPQLRRAIAQRYLELGYVVPVEEIVVTCGGTEAISLSLQAVAQKGDFVLIDSPTFFSGIQLIKQLDLNVIEMPTDPQEGLNIGLLDQTLSTHRVAACLLMTNCHNPLGFSMKEERKQALVEVLCRHDVPLIENDVNSELHFGPRHIRAAKAFDENGMVLHCGSFTKSLAPGFKIGWVAAGRYVSRIVNRKFATTLGTSIPPQTAIAHYLKNHSYDRHLRSLRRELQTRVNEMSQSVARNFPAGTRITTPQGGYVIWIELPPGTDSMALFEMAVSRHIGIAPGPIFSPLGSYRNFIRLNCSHNWSSKLEETIKWLGSAVSEIAAAAPAESRI
jgi:DNA-binding transcriptional MocR family regulator